MASLLEKLALAKERLSKAKNRVDSAENDVRRLKEYHASGTWYATYPTEEALAKEFDRRQHVIWDAHAEMALAEGQVIDLGEKRDEQLKHEKAAEMASAQAAENEQKRQKELQQKPEQKPELKPARKPRFTPG
jgi:hypothetical protein